MYSFFSIVFTNSKVYKTPSTPRVVLDKLAAIGYRVVAMSGVGQTCIWTLFKEQTNVDSSEHSQK